MQKVVQFFRNEKNKFQYVSNMEEVEVQKILGFCWTYEIEMYRGCKKYNWTLHLHTYVKS